MNGTEHGRAESTKSGGRLRTLIAVVVGMASLAVPAAAHALPPTEPDPEYEVEVSSPMPDLVMSASVETDWLRNYEGRYIREVKVTFTVKNYGDKAAGPFSATVRVNHLIWYGSGGWTGERVTYLDGLAAGASRNLAAVYVTDEACVKILGIADSGKKVVERSESNNLRYVVSESSQGACG
jgi:hypothetical protein